MVQLFYATYISVDLAHHELFHAKIGKGGIKQDMFVQGMITRAQTYLHPKFAFQHNLKEALMYFNRHRHCHRQFKKPHRNLTRKTTTLITYLS